MRESFIIINRLIPRQNPNQWAPEAQPHRHRGDIHANADGQTMVIEMPAPDR